MDNLEHARLHAASQLGALIDHHEFDHPLPDDRVHFAPAIDAIAEYTLALAVDRIRKAGQTTAGGRLAAAVLMKHCRASIHKD